MPIREELELDYSKYLKGLSAADRAAIKFAEKQENAYQNVSSKMKMLENNIRQLKVVRDASNSTASVKRYNSAIQGLQKEYDRLEKETLEYSKAVKKSEVQSDKSSNGIVASIKRIGQSFKFWISTIAIAALAGLQRASVQFSAEFENDFSQVRTLLNETEVDTRALRDRLIEISKIKAVPLSVLTPALYQAISSGINDINDALDVVSISADAAIAGNTNVETAVDGITTALNAWKMEANEAESVSDSFFVAVRNGKTTFEELSNTIGRVAPLASATNTTLDELLSSVAALTTGGLDTSEAMTSLRGILSKILKPTQQAKEEAYKLGIEFNESSLKAKGLYQFLNDVSEASEGNSESLGRLFEDVEAFNGVLSLTGSSSEAFSNNLSDMSKKSGETDIALSKVEKKLLKIWETTKNKVNAKLLEMGKTVLPLVGKALQVFNKTLEEFDDPSQVLINNLREIGADKNLIIKMQAELDIKKATQEFYDLEKSISNTKIPIEFTVNSRVVTAGEAQIAKGVLAAGQIQTSIISTQEIDVQTASIEELNEGLNSVKSRLEEIGAASTGFTDLTIAQREESNQLTQTIKKLEEIIEIRERQNTLQTVNANNYRALSELRKKADLDIEKEETTQKEAENIEKINSILDDYIDKVKIAKSLKESGGISNSGFIELNNQSTKETQKELQDLFGELEKTGQMTEELSQEFKEAFSIIVIDEEVFKKQTKIVTDFYDSIKEAVASDGNELVTMMSGFNDSINEITNDFNIGTISEEEFLSESSKKAKEFLIELKAIYSTLKIQGKITPELEKAFVSAFSKGKSYAEKASEIIEEANDEAKEVEVSFSEIADSLSGLLNVADAFGKIDDNLKNVLRGSIDVFRNLENIQKLDGGGLLGLAGTGLSGVIPALGVAAGLGSVISSLIPSGSDSDLDSKKINELNQSLEELKRAVQKNTEAFLRNDVIGSSTRNEDVNKVEELISSIQNSASEFDSIMSLKFISFNGEDSLTKRFEEFTEEQNKIFEGIFSNLTKNIDPLDFEARQQAKQEAIRRTLLSTSDAILSEDQIQNIFSEISELFPDLFGDFEEIYNNLRESGYSHFEALKKVLEGDIDFSGLGDSLTNLIDNFGKYGKTIGGAIAQFNDSLRFTDISPEEARLAFIDNLKGLGTNIPEALLNELATVDVNSERFNDIIEELFNNRNRHDYLGDLSPDSFTELLDFLKGLSGDVNSLEDLNIDSIQDAIDAFAARIRFGGQTINEAFDSFVSDFTEKGEIARDFGSYGSSKLNLDDHEGPITQLLESLSDFDLSTAEGQGVLTDVIKRLFDNRDSLQGAVSDTDYDALLNFLKGLENTSISQETPGVSRSVQAVSSITEFQANDLIVLTEAQLFEMSKIHGVELEQLQAIKNMSLMLHNLSFVDNVGPGIRQKVSVTTENKFNQAFNFQSPLKREDINQVMNEIRTVLEKEFLRS